MRRAELAALLWNDRNENYAKQSLRQALAELRPVIGDALIADSEAVLIDLDEIKLDAHAFENAVRLERWDEAAQLWGGDFLNGLDALASATYGDPDPDHGDDPNPVEDWIESEPEDDYEAHLDPYDDGAPVEWPEPGEE